MCYQATPPTVSLDVLTEQILNAFWQHSRVSAVVMLRRYRMTTGDGDLGLRECCHIVDTIVASHPPRPVAITVWED